MTVSSDLLRRSPLAAGLTEDQLADISDVLRPIHVSAGHALVREGDPSDRWYLIAEGAAKVSHRDLLGELVTLAVLGPGDSFGEGALTAEPRPRSASVIALTDLDGFVLDRSEFLRVNDASALEEGLERRLDVMAIDTALKRASPFALLPQSALEFLAQRLVPRHCVPGETIIRQGNDGDCLHLIRSGKVRVVRSGRQVAVLGTGDSFGEATLLTGKPRTATVQAIDRTELLSLHRADFLAVASQYANIALYFRELIDARLPGALNQPLLLPEPISTLMPNLGVRAGKRYWTVLGVGTLLFLLLSVAAEAVRVPVIVYALTVVGALVVPIVFVQYLAESNILSERPFDLIATGLLGAALGLPPAYAVQHAAGLVPGSLSASAVIGAIEEVAKLLGIVWLLWRPELRFRMDGVIFGAAAGMGFAALETVLYGAARVETAPALVGVLWARALLAPFSHGTWTAIVGATLWRERRNGLKRGVTSTLAALAIVIGLHTLWDWSAAPVPFNVAWLVVVGVASIIVLRLIRHQAATEEAYSVAALAPEVGRVTQKTVSAQCQGCGRRAPAGARYCPRCGRALSTARRSVITRELES